jgi:hypothetical protein
MLEKQDISRFLAAFFAKPSGSCPTKPMCQKVLDYGTAVGA